MTEEIAKEDIIYVEDSDEIEDGEIINDDESDQEHLENEFSWSDLNVLMVGDERILSLCWTELNGYPKQDLFYQPGGTTKDICLIAERQISEKHDIVIVFGFHYDLCFYEYRQGKQMKLRKRTNLTSIVDTVKEYSAKWKKIYPNKYFIWAMPYPVDFYKHNEHLKGSAKTLFNDKEQIKLTELYYSQVDVLFQEISKSNLNESFVFNVNKLSCFEHIFHNLSDYLTNGLFPKKDISRVFAYYFVEFLFKTVFSSKNVNKIDLKVAKIRLRYLKSNYFSYRESRPNLLQPIANSKILYGDTSKPDINLRPYLSEVSCHSSTTFLENASTSKNSLASLNLDSGSSDISLSSTSTSRTSSRQSNPDELSDYTSLKNESTTKPIYKISRHSKYRLSSDLLVSKRSKSKYTSNSSQSDSKTTHAELGYKDSISPLIEKSRKPRSKEIPITSKIESKKPKSPLDKSNTNYSGGLIPRSVSSSSNRSYSDSSRGSLIRKNRSPKVNHEAPNTPLGKSEASHCLKSEKHCRSSRSKERKNSNSTKRPHKSSLPHRSKAHKPDNHLSAAKHSTNIASEVTHGERNKPLVKHALCSTTISKTEVKTSKNYETTNKDEEIQFWKALKRLKDVHDVECDVFRNNPTSHPSYPREKIKFFDDYYIAKTAKCKPWDEFWIMRMEELFQEKWSSSKIQLSLECSKIVKNKLPDKIERCQLDSPLQPPSLPIDNESLLEAKSSSNLAAKVEETENIVLTSARKFSTNLVKGDNSSYPCINLASPLISSPNQINIIEELDFDIIMEDPIFKQGLDDIDFAVKTVFKDETPSSCASSSLENNTAKDSTISAAIFPCVNSMIDYKNYPNPQVKLPMEDISYNNIEKMYNCENKNINTEFLYIMKMLSRLSKQLGPLGISISEIYSNAKTSYDSTNNALAALDSDAKAVLDLVGKKIKHLLNSELSTIQRAIFGEVLERTRHFLADLRFHSTKFPKVDMKNIAITIKDRDVASAIEFIKSSLQYYGYLEFSGHDLMDIYRCVQNC